ncbi:ATP-binding cassette domain-containing protein [Rarobacter incanus]|uniref:Putative ABC transport system ATP-binding protein/putative hydroxymethylpyrimidine transport system ATP-binding protein n=1 Tax=Rarobacter incanus TaxID=153494 RepID=A0A542SPL2_9MICO|nr:ATP-binding cassette domain-containing protein [Rarobacter incanus]TQK76532.1 putative ABC transport system ATP-binding protein/putative hydroxymethylpyrimidine transport system ATP-binding protein [Rarobacter incanus]
MRVEVRGASLGFGKRIVFEGLDADFPDGKVTALVGPSGSGKSSLLAAMAGYINLKAGTITGVDERGSVPLDASMVAWVPQGSNALGGRTALENVMIGSLADGARWSQAKRDALHALDQVGLSDLAHKVARSLSGGELQRVNFARALATHKPLVFADEPSASLDATNTRRVAELLFELRSRATIIVATHDPLLVEAAEHEINLRQDVLHAA